MIRKKIVGIVITFLLLVVINGSYQFTSKQIDTTTTTTITETTNMQKVELSKCVDGDTAWFIINGEDKKARFLYIDTPESTNQIEPYGKEASEFTCQALSTATEIYIEYNPTGDTQDKYGRELVWVFVDGELLQELIALEGYVEKYYDYNVEYLYKDIIIDADLKAQENKVGIYSENN